MKTTFAELQNNAPETIAKATSKKKIYDIANKVFVYIIILSAGFAIIRAFVLDFLIK